MQRNGTHLLVSLVGLLIGGGGPEGLLDVGDEGLGGALAGVLLHLLAVLEQLRIEYWGNVLSDGAPKLPAWVLCGSNSNRDAIRAE